jgi:hypothetical protein
MALGRPSLDVISVLMLSVLIGGSVSIFASGWLRIGGIAVLGFGLLGLALAYGSTLLSFVFWLLRRPK